MKIINKLQSGATRLEEERKTLPELDALEARLQGEAERLVETLQNVDAKLLLQVRPEGDKLPADAAAKLQQLNGVKERLGLIPGARANVQRRITALEEELEELYRNACAECKDSAVSKLQEDLAAEAQRNLSRCGGDGHRAMKAALAAMEHSELKRWAEWFSSRRPHADIVFRIRQFADFYARYEGGQPLLPPPGRKAEASEQAA
jgi:hypothetical protein